jgi:hypothetical protein
MAAGDTPNEIARRLIEDEHLGPISAIKAMRSGGDMRLGEAKQYVHRNLPIEQQRAAEQLWDEAIAALEADEEERP